MRIGPAELTELFPQLVQAQGCQGYVDQAPRFAEAVVGEIGIRHLEVEPMYA